MQKSFISKGLSKARENAGYSMENLAELIDCDAELIDQWEVGTLEPSITQLMLLSRLYGMNVEDMFPDFEEKDVLPKVKTDDFSHNSWLNKILNSEY